MRIALLLFVLSYQPLLAQELASYISVGSPQKNKSFSIVFIEDSTKNKLSSVLPQRRVFKYSNKTHKAVSQLIQNFAIGNENAKPFIAIVKRFDVFDEKKAAYNYVGQINVEIDFYSIYDGDTTLFYNGVGGGTFNFQYRDKAVKDIGAFSKQVLTTICTRFEKELERNRLKLPSFNVGSQVTILPFRNSYIEDTVFYQRGKISWRHFKGSPNKASQFTASIFPGFAFGSSIEIKNGKLLAQLEPYVYMLPNLSWVRLGGNTEYALAHEQLHFDISYLSCLKMLDRVKGIETTSVKDLQSYIQYEYLMAYKEMNKLQEAYDGETRHGLNKIAQEGWERRIRFEILEYEK